MSNIKIFKLVNGDEIIGSMLESSDENSIKVEKPMIFKTSTMIDNKGYPYDLTILRDWMTRTDDKIAEIQKNQISTTFSPNENTIKLYNLEIMKSEIENTSDDIITGKDMLNKLSNPASFEDILESFMNNVNDIIEPPPPSRKRSKRKRKPAPEVDDPALSSMIPDELKERPMIYLSMVIPPEAIMNLVSAGILEPEQLLLMIEEVKKKNKFTGDEKKRDDFGNKFSDWNPDPNSKDYE